MSLVLKYLDCGCAITEDGTRSWCPTCAGGGPSPAPNPLLPLLREAREALKWALLWVPRGLDCTEITADDDGRAEYELKQARRTLTRLDDALRGEVVK